MDYTAHALYGGRPPMQPTPTPSPDHVVSGRPEPVARTLPPVARKGLADPMLVLVAIIGLVVLLVQVSVRIDLKA